MVCFRDMTFCTYYKKCADGKGCFRAFTEEQSKMADIWWGKEGAPICWFAEKPGCFKKILDKQD